MVFLGHEDVELLGDAAHAVTHRDADPVGARALGLGGSPRHQTVGGHGQPRRTVRQPVGQDLCGQVAVGGLHVEGEQRPLGHTARGHQRDPARQPVRLQDHHVEFLRHGDHTVAHGHPHPVGAGALGLGRLPLHHAVGAHGEPLGPAQQAEDQGLHRQVGVGGLQRHAQPQPLGDPADPGIRPHRRLVPLQNDDLELVGGRGDAVGGEDAHEIGAGTLGLGGLPGQDAVGRDREADRSVGQSVGDGLAERIGIGGLQGEGQPQSLADPPRAHVGPHRWTVEAGADPESHRRGRRDSDPDVPIALQRRQVPPGLHRDPFRLRPGSRIGEGERRQRRRLVGTDLQLGLAGQRVEVEGDARHVAGIPEDELEVDGPIGGRRLEPEPVIQGLEHRIGQAVVGHDRIRGRPAAHAGHAEIPPAAGQRHRRRVGGDQDVLVAGPGPIALVLEGVDGGYGQAIARTEHQVVGRPAGLHPKRRDVGRHGDVVEVVVLARMTGGQSLTELELPDPTALLDGRDGVGGSGQPGDIGDGEVPEARREGHRLAVEMDDEGLVGAARVDRCVVGLAPAGELGSPDGIQVEIPGLRGHGEGHAEHVAGGHLVRVVVLQVRQGVGDPELLPMDQRSDAHAEVGPDRELVGRGAAGATDREVVALPPGQQGREIGADDPLEEPALGQTPGEGDRVRLRGFGDA